MSAQDELEKALAELSGAWARITYLGGRKVFECVVFSHSDAVAAGVAPTIGEASAKAAALALREAKKP